ncbi:hypothetical protein [Leptospira santarosai]|uniref:hypothetical protein n=1 Tax=Leptospira santarosai TaxID=28183 RepID=UPI00077421E3|nr:hypothetical protein [Leptospira santarosai]MDI7196311.1 hypothetical protein [Leptospira santarosai]MDI7202117.1 hypothetical protein [Leptospira santarosai]
MNQRILNKAEDLSQRYESRQDQISFLIGFVEGYKHLKATRSGDDAYENGRVCGEKEFKGLNSSTLTPPILRVVK